MNMVCRSINSLTRNQIKRKQQSRYFSQCRYFLWHFFFLTQYVEPLFWSSIPKILMYWNPIRVSKIGIYLQVVILNSRILKESKRTASVNGEHTNNYWKHCYYRRGSESSVLLFSRVIFTFIIVTKQKST